MKWTTLLTCCLLLPLIAAAPASARECGEVDSLCRTLCDNPLIHAKPTDMTGGPSCAIDGANLPGVDEAELHEAIQDTLVPLTPKDPPSCPSTGCPP